MSTEVPAGGNQQQWARLPVELMEPVLQALGSEGRSVRAVCSGWCKSYDGTRTRLRMTPRSYYPIRADESLLTPFSGADSDFDQEDAPQLPDGEDAPKSSAWAKARVKAAKLAAPTVTSLLLRFPPLERFSLEGRPFYDEWAFYRARLIPKLFVKTVLDDGLVAQGATATLSVLRLQACIVSLEAMKLLSNFSSLETLDLSHSFLPGHFGQSPVPGGSISPRRVMEALGKLTGLQELILEDFGFYVAQGGGGPYHSIELGEGVQYLSPLTALTSLNLKLAAGLTPAAFRTLNAMTSLKTLNLRGSHHKEAMPGCFRMSALSGLTALTSLNLQDTVMNASDAELEELSRLTALKTLRMGEAEDNRGYHFRGTCTATAAGIEALSALTGLTELNLKGWLHAQAMQTLEARVPALHALCVADKGDPPVFDWLL